MSQLTIAKALQSAFVEGVRDDQTTYVHLAEGCPAWMTEMVHDAHSGRMPNDTDYSAIREVVDAVVEALEEDEDMDDARAERCEGLVPYTNHAHVAWLATHSDYVLLCDDAAEEGRVAEGARLMERIHAGYVLYYEQLWGYVVTAIEEQWQQEDDADL